MLISKVMLSEAPIFRYHSTLKSLYYPAKMPKTFKKLILRLKQIIRITTEILKYCKIVILMKVDMVSSFLVYFFSKDDIKSKIVHAITLITAIMIGAPYLIA